MSHRTTAAQPERVLMQFFADAFGFERILMAIKRFENAQCGVHERIVREHAAPADGPAAGAGPAPDGDVIDGEVRE